LEQEIRILKNKIADLERKEDKFNNQIAESMTIMLFRSNHHRLLHGQVAYPSIPFILPLLQLKIQQITQFLGILITIRIFFTRCNTSTSLSDKFINSLLQGRLPDVIKNDRAGI